MTKYEELLSMLLEFIKEDIEHIDKINEFINKNYVKLMANEKSMIYVLEFKKALEAVNEMREWTIDDLDSMYEDLFS